MSFEPLRLPYLHHEIGRWLEANPAWYLRPLEHDAGDQYDIFWMQPAWRYAGADEVAAHIVDDPALREILGFLVSPPGQAIEQAIARVGLSPLQAELLTDGLTRAWRIVLDQNRPVWQRTDVLAGTGLILAAIGTAIWAGRRAA